MVKPALPYLDVLSAVASTVNMPVAAYQVSDEYAMVEAAAANGWLERERMMPETFTSIRRAGADAILTYRAEDAAPPPARALLIRGQYGFSQYQTSIVALSPRPGCLDGHRGAQPGCHYCDDVRTVPAELTAQFPLRVLEATTCPRAV